mmetsp:Transcript_3510/g.5796  ORF Transcript_3510/g.5796 Transcript_3510/m.5796 type:complete len:95 (-) Transcript_3510:1152-1436(-)
MKRCHPPFFANITSINCKLYKLEAFSEQSHALPVIKEKLKNRAYISVEDFVYDFNQMFQNIFKFYPESHGAIQKAIELSKLFDERWQVALTKFK